MRVPPHNLDAEMAVLGSVLLRNDAINAVLEMPLAPEDFYKPAHEHVFRAMIALFERGEPIDYVTLGHELRRAGKEEQAGGVTYLAELHARVPTAENVGHYGRLVRDTSTLRQLINRASDIAAKGFAEAGDVNEYLDLAEQQVFELAQRNTRGTYRPIKPIVGEVFDSLKKRMDRHDSVTGVPTGFSDLDRMTCGLQPGELIILAARPSVGKTSFAVNLGLHAALECGLPVLIFSLEMSSEAVAERVLCSSARIDSSRVRGGFLDGNDWQKLYGVAGRVSRAPLFIDDAAAPTALEIRAKARRFRSDRNIFAGKDLGLVIVDYLQLVKPGSRADSREQEVAQVSRGLKALAKELRCPVLALSQLNRAVEDREDGRPRLSDLRESGSIEQDADVVAFLHRPPKTDDDTGLVTLSVAKQRNGPIGEVELVFLRQYTRFESRARHD